MRFAILSLLVLCSLPAVAAGPATTSGVDTAAMDKAVNPCVDFYQFACGNWMATHPIPADRARWGRFDELQERNEALLLGIVKKAAENRASRTPGDQKIGDFFASCMDTASIEKKGIEPLKEELARIQAIG